MTVFYLNEDENGGHEAQSRMFARELGAEIAQITIRQLISSRDYTNIFCLGNIYQWPLYVLLIILIIPRKNRFIYLPFFRFGKKLKFLKRIWLRLMLRHFSIITISELEKRYLKLHRSNAIVTVRKNRINGSLKGRPTSQPDQRKLDLYVIGRLYNEQKGLRRLAKYAEIIKERHLHLLGETDGNALDSFITELGPNSVTSHGFIENPWEVINGVLLMPSVYEGLPLVLMEASKLNVPVVAQNIPELRLLVQKQFLYDFENGSFDDLRSILNLYDSGPCRWSTNFLNKYMNK